MIGLIKGTARQVKSVSGLPLPIATYNGNLKAPIKKLSLSVNPTQAGSGDPYPAGGGKNKLDGIDPYTVEAGGAIYPTIGTVALTAGTTYTFSCKQVGTPTSGTRNRFAVSKVNNIWDSSTVFGTDAMVIPSMTFTPTDTQIYYVFIWTQGMNANLTYSEFQCEVGSSSTSFAPYSNIRPITGVSSVNVSRTGKNLLPMPITSGSYPNQVTITVNNDKSFYISKPSGSGWTTIPLATMMLKKGTYTLIEDDDSSDNCAINVYLAGTTTSLLNTRYAKRYVFTVAEDTKVDINYSRSTMANNVLTKLMLFVGNTATATDYEAYTGNTYTIDLDGTRYGGTIDVVRGKLVVTHGYVEYDGTENWQTDTSRNGVYLLFSTMGTHVYGIGCCDRLKTITNSSGMNSLGIAFGINNYAIYIPHLFDSVSGITDVASWKTYLSNNNMQVCYPLDTPIEIDLTPTQINSLLGQNNIWHENGDVDELVYQNRQLYYGR